MKNNLQSLILIFLTIFCFSFLPSQRLNSTEINHLIDKAESLYINGKSDHVLDVSKQIIEQSKSSNYEKGLSYGYYYQASYYYDYAKFKQSIDYAKRAQNYSSYLKNDKTHSAKISSLLGGNYLLLDLYTLAFRNYRKALNTLNSKPDKSSQDSLIQSAAYSHLSYMYANINKPDSTYYFLQKENSILKRNNFKDSYIQKGCSCLGFGNYYLERKVLDSAQYYYNKSLENFSNKDHPCKIESLIGLGNLHSTKNYYNKAEIFYNMALKSFNGQHFPDILSELYKKMAELKVSQGIPSEAKHYQELYLTTHKKLDDRIKKERDFVLNEVMKEEKIKNKQEVNKTRKITLIVICVLLIITLLIIYLLKKIKTEKKETVEMTEKLVREKEIQEKETQRLKQKVNESFEEIIQLAKENDSSFYTRFQEVYPNFQVKMLEINEKLKTSELTFAAYVYLGFTTKEIADYTFKAVKTIENNRYNFRKKINLSPEKDLQIWLRNYIDSE